MIRATRIEACAPDTCKVKAEVGMCTAKDWSPEHTETQEERREGGRKPTRKTNGQTFLEEAWVPIGAWKDANVSSIAS